VVGALQDHHRAIVLGVPTFGKGSVQTVYPLDGGAGLRLTTALYYTPAGRSIQEVGITPDFEVKQADDPQLGYPTRRRVREKDLDGHFTQEDASDLSEGDGPTGRIVDPEQSSDGDGQSGEVGDQPSVEAEVPQDVQLTRAVEVLKSWTYFDDLRRLQEESTPEVQDPQAVAAAEIDEN
jgi:carboxyl-terminal processing protease